MSDAVDLLAIAAHRDDVELTCGGTLAKAVRAGHRVGILDLTEGEMGTRGDAATRAAEADKAAKTLGVTIRLNAGMRDAHLERIRSHGYSFQQEVLYRCHRAGCKVGETPIVFEDRRAGSSKVNLKEARRSMSLLLWLGLRAFFGLDRG